jgi:hypothetical protein
MLTYLVPRLIWNWFRAVYAGYNESITSLCLFALHLKHIILCSTGPTPTYVCYSRYQTNEKAESRSDERVKRINMNVIHREFKNKQRYWNTCWMSFSFSVQVENNFIIEDLFLLVYTAVYSVESQPKFRATCFHDVFLLDLFFDPEDGGDMFLRNVNRLSTDYTESYPRRQNFS